MLEGYQDKEDTGECGMIRDDGPMVPPKSLSSCTQC